MALAKRHCLVLAAVAALAACESTIGDAPPGIGPGVARPDAGGEEPPPPRPDAAPPIVPIPDGGRTETVLSQNLSEEIEDLHSIACVQRNDNGDPVQTRENSFYRVFALEDEGVAGDFAVSAVRFGVESARTPDQTSLAGVVRLHTLDGAFELGGMTEIASAPVDIAPQDGTVVEVPIAATVEAGSTLVAELFIENQNAVGRLFFIGSNSQGQTAPSYLRAPSQGCALPEPTDLADVGDGFPDVHVVLSVRGAEF
jgi:hypothetical protein